MKWFLDLTTRAKLFLGFGLMVVLLVAVTITAYTGIAALQQAQQRIYGEAFANAIDLLAIRTNLNGARSSLLMMILVTASSDQEFWQRDVEERSRQINEVLNEG